LYLLAIGEESGEIDSGGESPTCRAARTTNRIVDPGAVVELIDAGTANLTCNVDGEATGGGGALNLHRARAA